MNSRPAAARRSQEPGFTQPRDHSFAQPCIAATRYLLFPSDPPPPQKRKCCIPPPQRKRKRRGPAAPRRRFAAGKNAQDLRRLQSVRESEREDHHRRPMSSSLSGAAIFFRLNKLRASRAEIPPSIPPSLHSFLRSPLSRPSPAFTGLFCRRAAIPDEQGPSLPLCLPRARSPSGRPLSLSLSSHCLQLSFHGEFCAAVFLVAKSENPFILQLTHPLRVTLSAESCKAGLGFNGTKMTITRIDSARLSDLLLNFDNFWVFGCVSKSIIT